MSVWPCTKCGMHTFIEIYRKNDGNCNSCSGISEDPFVNIIETEDIINKPKHYNFATIEPIDVIEDWDLDFRLANAIKYISRAGKKDKNKTKEDLQKAIWYINRYILKECKDDQ